MSLKRRLQLKQLMSSPQKKCRRTQTTTIGKQLSNFELVSKYINYIQEDENYNRHYDNFRNRGVCKLYTTRSWLSALLYCATILTGGIQLPILIVEHILANIKFRFRVIRHVLGNVEFDFGYRDRDDDVFTGFKNSSYIKDKMRHSKISVRDLDVKVTLFYTTKDLKNCTSVDLIRCLSVDEYRLSKLYNQHDHDDYTLNEAVEDLPSSQWTIFADDYGLRFCLQKIKHEGTKSSFEQEVGSSVIELLRPYLERDLFLCYGPSIPEAMIYYRELCDATKIPEEEHYRLFDYCKITFCNFIKYLNFSFKFKRESNNNDLVDAIIKLIDFANKEYSIFKDHVNAHYIVAMMTCLDLPEVIYDRIVDHVYNFMTTCKCNHKEEYDAKMHDYYTRVKVDAASIDTSDRLKHAIRCKKLYLSGDFVDKRHEWCYRYSELIKLKIDIMNTYSHSIQDKIDKIFFGEHVLHKKFHLVPKHQELFCGLSIDQTLFLANFFTKSFMFSILESKKKIEIRSFGLPMLVESSTGGVRTKKAAIEYIHKEVKESEICQKYTGVLQKLVEIGSKGMIKNQ